MLPLLFSLCICYQDFEKNIPDVVVDVPVTVVFLGNHKSTSKDMISTKLKEKWYKDLTHTVEQEESNLTTQFATSETSKSPPLKFKFSFQNFDLPPETHEPFEKALKLVSWKIQENAEFVHSSVVESLLQSLVDFYKLPGIVFFALNLEHGHKYFCEGAQITKDFVIPEERIEFPEKLEIDTSGQIPWSRQIYDLIDATKGRKMTYFSGWNTQSHIYMRLNQSETLSEELNPESFKNFKCSNKWFTKGRIMWANMRQNIDDAFKHVSSVPSKENDDDKLADLKKTYEMYCRSRRNRKQEYYCRDLEAAIKELEEQPAERIKRDQNILAYMGSLSSIIIDGLKEVVTPITPTYLTPFADQFNVAVTIFNDSKNAFPKKEFEKLLNSYLLPKAKAEYKYDEMDFFSWPAIGIPINTKVGYCNTEVVNSERSSYYTCTNPSYFREDLSGFEVTHALTSEKNATVSTRDIVANVIVGDSKPILMSKRSTSFAFDWVTLGTFTTSRSDIRPILRSVLTHMYGLSSSEKWYSPTIMSPFSTHTAFGQLSKDAAYRNGMRSILSKGRAKILKRLKEVTKLIDLTKEYNITNNLSCDYLAKQVDIYSNSLSEVLKYASKFEFETMKELLVSHRIKQKEFSKHLKEIAKDLNDQLCTVAPSIIVQKGTKPWDKVDSIAVMILPFWVGLLFVSLLAAFIAFSRKVKLA